MIGADPAWPDGFTIDAACFTVDVEWAADAVLDDIRGLFDQHGVRATFFVTHAGVAVPGHERGLHPNFRRSGDTYRAIPRAGELSDSEIQEHVVSTTLAFAPEAKGVRSHSLYYDSTLLPLYQRLGIEYDCSYQMPLVAGLRPFWKHHGIIEVPTYYADHLDLMTGISDFQVQRLGLDRPGIKVFDFHPNVVFLNAASDTTVRNGQSIYHDPARLLAARHQGRGIRTLLLDLLSYVRKKNIPTMTVGDVNRMARSAASGR